MKRYNFNAGPSILPKEVIEEAAAAILNFNNTGLSILEFGHRTPEFTAVMDEAIQLVKLLLNLDAHHEVLFLHGGASTQFMQVPMNFLRADQMASYADTGVWSSKAIKEARLFGNVSIACSSKDKQYSYIPKNILVPDGCRYFHFTSNNTIYGTQWNKMPDVNTMLVADMSSDIFSRVLDFNSFGLIYAGAQKNLGPAGVNLLIVDSRQLKQVNEKIPTILDYRNHINEKSMLNTPPVFAIYVCLLTLRWLQANGGVSARELVNKEKARLLYEEIDTNPLFTGTVAKEDRSLMNACFVMQDAEIEAAFLKYSEERGIVGIKGHRLVGGFRASMYNAMPLERVQYLVQVMKDFATLRN